VSNWGYVTIAYTVVWGSLAVYAIVLARRVSQAREVAARLRDAAYREEAPTGTAPDGAVQSAAGDTGVRLAGDSQSIFDSPSIVDQDSAPCDVPRES
jgi:hypothetical protein